MRRRKRRKRAMSELRCLRAKEIGSRIQYTVEGVFSDEEGKKIPFYVMVLPHHASYQTIADRHGEKLTEQFIRVFGIPAEGPTVVKGGACGGEVGELAGELDIHGAMMSLVWDGDRFDRGQFIDTLKEFLKDCL
jgi:hypothetical protein